MKLGIEGQQFFHNGDGNISFWSRIQIMSINQNIGVDENSTAHEDPPLGQESFRPNETPF